jgi:hypothetical protein
MGKGRTVKNEKKGRKKEKKNILLQKGGKCIIYVFFFLSKFLCFSDYQKEGRTFRIYKKREVQRQTGNKGNTNEI